MQFSSILPAGIAAAYWNWVQKVLVTSLCVHLLVWSPFCSKPSLLVPVLCPYFYWSRSILFNDLIAFSMKSWSFTKKAFPSFLPVKQASVSCFLWSPLQGFCILALPQIHTRIPHTGVSLVPIKVECRKFQWHEVMRMVWIVDLSRWPYQIHTAGLFFPSFWSVLAGAMAM